MAKDFSKLIAKKSIFSNLKSVDYFDNRNARGFTPETGNGIKPPISDYKGVRSGTYRYTGILPNVIRIGRPTLFTTNWFEDTFANGFTADQDKLDKTVRSKFINLNGEENTYSFPAITDVNNVPYKDKSYNIDTQQTKGNDFFSNVAAKGFTPNRLNTNLGRYAIASTSDFIGIRNKPLSFTYPSQLSSLLPKELKNIGLVGNYAVDYFSGIKKQWGVNTLPKGFTILQSVTEFLNKNKTTNFLFSDFVLNPLLWTVDWKDKNLANYTSTFSTTHTTYTTEIGFGQTALTTDSGLRYSYFDRNENYLKTNNSSSIYLSNPYKFDASRYTSSDKKVTSFSTKTFGDAKENFKNIVSSLNPSYYGTFVNKDGKLGIKFGQGTQSSYNKYSINIAYNQIDTLDNYYKLSQNSNNLFSAKNAKFQIFGPDTNQPYVITDIPSTNNNLFEDNLFRAGVVTTGIRIANDTKRISRFLTSPTGLQFITKQFGLQAMNPRPETRTWNPLSILSSVGGSALGKRTNRHGGLLTGLFGADKYEDTDEADLTQLDSNRLVGFKTFLFDDRTPSFFTDYVPSNTLKTPGVSLAQHSIYGFRLGILSWPSDFGYLRSTAGNNKGKTDRAYEGDTGKTGPNNKKYIFRSHAQFLDLTRDGDKSYEKLITQDRGNFTTAIAKNYDDKNIVGVSAKIYNQNGVQVETKYNEFGFGEQTTKKFKALKQDSFAKTKEYDHLDKTSNISRKGKFFKPVLKDLDPIKFGSDNDIALLTFTPYSTIGTAINFRAIVENYTDNFSPSYNNVTYVGNPINYPIYQNTKRNIQLSFKVPIYWDGELSDIKQRLNKLTNYTYATVESDKMATPFMKFKYLGVVNDVVCVITSLVYTIDSTTPWVGTEGETAAFKPDFPMIVNVSINLDVIPNTVPISNAYTFIGA